MSHPRRRDKFWMVTLADEKPEWYREDVPSYYPTRREAAAYKAGLESDPDYDGSLLIVKESDEPWDSIAWPWMDDR